MKNHFWTRLVLSAAVVMLTTSFAFSQMTPMNTSSAHFVNNLMPQPVSLSATGGSYVLPADFHAAVNGFDNARLDGAIARALHQMRYATGLPMTTETIAPTPRRGAPPTPPAPPTAISSPQLIVTVQGAGEEVQSIDEVESYSLSVTASGVHIDAPTVVGAMHGLATLVQLIQPSGNSYVLPYVSIQDSPRFPWRGLMIDCGRHFEPMDVIKRSIDAMAAVKLNVFHWHLTEDQGFRMESKVYPKLTEIGSDGLFYTQDDAREIVRYARDRGIRVVPEFEMPGHSTAWQVAYPELASGKPPAGIRREFGVSPYALDPTREETYEFLSKFLAEMATIFPDPYFHIGGDETPAPDWKTNPRIQAFMKAHDLKDSAALQAYFNTRVLKILTGLHKQMMGWDEILNPALPRDVMIQSWRGEKSLAEGAQQGFQGILSAGYYLDGQLPAGKHYLVDPLPVSSTLTEAQRKLILGGETPMWGEQIYERTIDSRIWPRAAAIAERFWSPQNVTDVDDMYRRLAVVTLQLEGLGLHHIDQEAASLRELAGTDNIGALSIFATAFEPVSFGERYQQQRTSQLTVLDRFVDAVRSDPPSRYAIELGVSNFLKAPQSDTADRDALNNWFAMVAASVPAVKAQMPGSPLLAEMESRADQLPGLAKIAHEALGYLASGKKAPAGWKSNALQHIATAKRPSGLVRFVFLDVQTNKFVDPAAPTKNLDPLTALVNAVQE